MSRSPMTRRVLAAAQREDRLVTFVYGTLRPGEGNYWIEPAVIEAIEPCTTPGIMYAAGIPYCDFKTLKDQGTVVGTLLIMDWDNHRRLVNSMIGMERGAGYEAVEIPITLPGHRSPTVKAFAWHHRRTARGEIYGTRVPSGNWFDHYHSAHYRQAHSPAAPARRNWWEEN